MREQVCNLLPCSPAPLLPFILLFFLSPERRKTEYIGKKIHATGKAAFLLIALVFSLISFNRTIAWKDDYVLLKDTAGKSPNKARPHSNLAGIAYIHGLYDEAFFEAQKTIGLYYYHPNAHYIIGLTLYDKGRYAESLKAYGWALITAEKYLNNPAYMAQIHK